MMLMRMSFRSGVFHGGGSRCKASDRHAQAFRQHDYQLFLYQHPHPASLRLREKTSGSISHWQNRRLDFFDYEEHMRLIKMIRVI